MADEGFLGRWARRKEAVRTGKVVEAEPVPGALPPPQPSPSGGGGQKAQATVIAGGTQSALAAGSAAEGGAAVQAPPPPPPTLEDAQQLTSASDFSRYVRADVPANVKNAAMKKLFADPHFNVRDRLDIYIDDYSQPDPLPPEMLRQLAGAKFLNLFDEDPAEPAVEPATASPGREVANDPTVQSVAESGSAPQTEPEVPPPEDHADPDLRLQQDDAPGPEGPGAGAR